MRIISQKNFLKILSGGDYEFLINRYSFELMNGINASNLKSDSAHKLHFDKCKFKSFVCSESVLKSTIVFKNCTFNRVEFNHSELESLTFDNCTFDQLIFKSNSNIGSLTLGGCKVNRLTIEDNQRFHLIHIGCENLLDKADIKNNGQLNNREAKLYLCPEEFNKIDIAYLKVDKVEVGTLGRYSDFKLNNIWAEEVLLSNCDDSVVNAAFMNIQPIYGDKIIVKLLNSRIKADIFQSDLYQHDSIKFDLDSASILK